MDRAVIDVTKHQGLDSLPGYPFEVRTSASTREQAGRLVRTRVEPCVRHAVLQRWYQFRFTMMAKGLIDAAGPDVLRRLWDAFVLSDEQLAGVLGGRVHPEAGHWLASWDEP
jgi:hypothetical protein